MALKPPKNNLFADITMARANLTVIYTGKKKY